MVHRCFALSLTACVSLLLVGFGMPARADFGVTSKRPLSDPRRTRIDEPVTGTWRAVINGKTYYLHVGAGNIVGKVNWTELVLINPGEKKPSFYLNHLIGFSSKLGDESYFNVAHMSKLIPQLRGAKIEQLLSSVERYEVFKYKLTGDHLDVWIAEQKLIAKAIEDGKIKGGEGGVDDTAENLIGFIESSAPKLFVNRFRYTRIKEPDSPPPDEPSTFQPPPEPTQPAAEPGSAATKSPAATKAK